jgi:4-amino-4-deoxy-L-arabinose transferase-like glycosyltransferase
VNSHPSSILDRIHLDSRVFLILLLLLSGLGIALVMTATRLGAGLTDDSYYYIRPAREALAGRGFQPSTSFSPLLPTALLMLGWLGIEPLNGAHFLNAFLFGANIFIVGWITRKVSYSNWAGLLAALLVALSENLIDAHAWVMSEPLYFTFLLLTLLAAVEYYPRRSFGWLLAAGIFAGLAGLARYAALAILPAVGLALLIDSRVPFLRRLRDLVVFGFLGVLPVGLYFLRNIIISGQATHYSQYLYAPFTRDNVDWYLYNTLSWLIPGRYLHGHEIITALALALIAVALIVWAFSRGNRLHRGSFYYLTCLAGFIVTNFIMLYIARGFKELGIYNIRYLTPLLLTLLILIAAFCAWLWTTSVPWARIAILVACLAFSAYYALRSADYVRTTQNTGLGYANAGWYNSETIPYLRQHPDLNLIATGDIGVYFWTGKLPVTLAAYSDPQKLRDHMCQTGDELLIMSQMPAEIYGADHDQAVRGLDLVRQFNDSELYRCPVK